MELAQRLDITEKLREQVRELEKEKRDLQRRYNEQVAIAFSRVFVVVDEIYHLRRPHLKLRGKHSMITSSISNLASKLSLRSPVSVPNRMRDLLKWY